MFSEVNTELEDYIDIQLTKTFMGLDVLFKVQSDRLLHKVGLKLTIEKIILEVVGVYIWICVLDYLNKTQDSRSFGAKPPCQDLMKI